MTQTTDRCTECHEYIGDHKLSGDRCPPLDLAVVAITLTKQAVNCGDHAQDITSAVAARPDETVEHLIRRTLMRAVLKEHRGAQYLGEPGDATCPHDDDYDGDRHFESADGYWLCEDTAAGDFYCLGCPRDEAGDLMPHPCATWQAVAKALEER